MNTSNSETYCFDIITGPSKSVLFDWCQYAYDMSSKDIVNLTISQEYSNHSNDVTKLCSSPYVTDIMVTRIQHEDDSGESFYLEGNCQTDIDYLLWKEDNHHFRYHRFSAYYNTRNRTGKFTIIIE